MNVTFDRKIFNPIYWHIKRALKDQSIRFIFIYGGSSAGKTYTLVQALQTETLEAPSNTMVLRKFSVDIDDTVYKDFKDIGEKFNRFIPIWRFLKKLIYLNRSIFTFRGLDRSERIKGISSFKRIYMNELTLFNYADFNQIKKRLRGRPGQQIIGDWNPIDINHWINAKVIEKEHWIVQPNEIKGIPYSRLGKESWVKKNESGDTLLIKTTYLDNYWITGHPDFPKVGFKDVHVLADFQKDKIHNPEDYQIYALGEWGVLTSRLIFKNWKKVPNEIPPEFKKLPSGMDFGFSPDPTTLIDVYIHGQTMILDEILYDRNLTNIEIEGVEKSIEGELKKVNFNKEQTIIADSSEPKSISELRARGFNVYAAHKPPGSILSGLKIMKSYYICITERSKNLILEFKNYKRQVDKNDNILPDPVDADNHCIDPVRYVFLMKGRLW